MSISFCLKFPSLFEFLLLLDFRGMGAVIWGYRQVSPCLYNSSRPHNCGHGGSYFSSSLSGAPNYLMCAVLVHLVFFPKVDHFLNCNWLCYELDILDD